MKWQGENITHDFVPLKHENWLKAVKCLQNAAEILLHESIHHLGIENDVDLAYFFCAQIVRTLFDRISITKYKNTFTHCRIFPDGGFICGSVKFLVQIQLSSATSKKGTELFTQTHDCAILSGMSFSGRVTALIFLFVFPCLFSADTSQSFGSIFKKPLTISGDTIVGEGSIDGLINQIESDYWDNSALVYQSRSNQHGSEDLPRIILFKDSESPIIAFAGHSGVAGGNNIEIIDYDRKTHKFEFYEIAQKDGKVTVERNPTECMGCHTSSLRPNWDPYVLWPGSFGSIDDQIVVGSKEDKLFQKFLKNNRSKFRYDRLTKVRRHKNATSDLSAGNTAPHSAGKYRMIEDPTFSDKRANEAVWAEFYGRNKAVFEQLSLDSGQPLFAVQPHGDARSRARVNAHLGNIVFDQNSDRIIHQLRQSKNFSHMRYVYLMGLLRCEKYDKLSRFVAPAGTKPKKSYADIKEAVSGGYSLDDLKARGAKFSEVTSKVLSVLERSRGLSIEHMSGMMFLTQNQTFDLPYEDWATTFDLPYVFDDGLDGGNRFAAHLLREGFPDHPDFIKQFNVIDLNYGEPKWVVVPSKAGCEALKKVLESQPISRSTGHRDH